MQGPEEFTSRTSAHDDRSDTSEFILLSHHLRGEELTFAWVEEVSYWKGCEGFLAKCLLWPRRVRELSMTSKYQDLSIHNGESQCCFVFIS